jgi:hypothetical protein
MKRGRRMIPQSLFYSCYIKAYPKASDIDSNLQTCMVAANSLYKDGQLHRNSPPAGAWVMDKTNHHKITFSCF